MHLKKEEEVKKHLLLSVFYFVSSPFAVVSFFECNFNFKKLIIIKIMHKYIYKALFCLNIYLYMYINYNIVTLSYFSSKMKERERETERRWKRRK